MNRNLYDEFLRITTYSKTCCDSALGVIEKFENEYNATIENLNTIDIRNLRVYLSKYRVTTINHYTCVINRYLDFYEAKTGIKTNKIMLVENDVKCDFYYSEDEFLDELEFIVEDNILCKGIDAEHEDEYRKKFYGLKAALVLYWYGLSPQELVLKTKDEVNVEKSCLTHRGVEIQLSKRALQVILDAINVKTCMCKVNHYCHMYYNDNNYIIRGIDYKLDCKSEPLTQIYPLNAKHKIYENRNSIKKEILLSGIFSRIDLNKVYTQVEIERIVRSKMFLNSRSSSNVRSLWKTYINQYPGTQK